VQQMAKTQLLRGLTPGTNNIKNHRQSKLECLQPLLPPALVQYLQARL
jgi:hypothetical protein